MTDVVPYPGAVPYPDNAAYLEAELEWLDALLRLRLAARERPLRIRVDADGQGLSISPEDVGALLRDEPEPEREAEASLRQRLEILGDDLARRTEASLRSGVRLGLPRLRRLFGLSELETRVVLVCLAPELRRRYDTLYAYLQDDITRRRPSVDLALELLLPDEGERWRARDLFAPTAPLLRHGLLQPVNDPGSPSGSSGLALFLRLDPRVLHFLLDQPTLDARLHELAQVWTPQESPVADADDPEPSLASRLAGQAPHPQPLSQRERGARRGGRMVVHLHGPWGVGRHDLARAVCARLDRPLLRLDADRLPSATEEAGALLRLALRESLLLEAPLYLDQVDAPHTGVLRGLARAVHELGWLVFLAGEKPWKRPGLFDSAIFHSLRLATPGVSERERTWRRTLEELGLAEALGAAGELADSFRLTPAQIRDAAVAALRRSALDSARPLTADDLAAACRERSTPELDELALLIRPRAGWADLVLPADKKAQLAEICAQVKHRRRVYGEWGFGAGPARGRAVSALFSGPPGTGKTLAAEILARYLGLDLYKIDLSRVVSKYIGETEKNLSRIFAEAERGDAVLFFDEADALFGKRTEVSDAHDRYANVEVSYLLQKMEEHDGVVLLASNLRGNMDDAFLRRLRSLVEFPFPDAASRLEIWRAHFPPAAPVDRDVDCELLAERLKVAGGNIKNIVLAAAFSAAADGGVIGMRHIMGGARREFEKIGKLWNESLFGQTPRAMTSPRRGTSQE